MSVFFLCFEFFVFLYLSPLTWLFSQCETRGKTLRGKSSEEFFSSIFSSCDFPPSFSVFLNSFANFLELLSFFRFFKKDFFFCIVFFHFFCILLKKIIFSGFFNFWLNFFEKNYFFRFYRFFFIFS